MKKRLFIVVFLMGILCLTGLQLNVFSAKASSMTVSEQGREFIKAHEGYRDYAYNDGFGTVTIGWGHTLNVNGGITITREQAEAFFNQDMATWEAVVNTFASNNNITFTQQQFDALVSLEFNVGAGPLNSDTRLRRIIKNNISGSSVNPPANAVWEGFATWHHAGGRDVKGLFYRRMNEARLFALNSYAVNRNWSIPSWLTDGSAGPEVPDGWVPVEYSDDPIPDPDPDPRTENTVYSAWVPFSTYAIPTGKVTVYDNSGTAYSLSSRYIDGNSDLCVIQKVYTDGFCEVRYPSSASSTGYNTALARLSDFISSPSPSAFTASAAFTAYRRSGGSDTIGSVSSGDRCLRVASANGRTQVIYPTSTSHKMGWITTSSDPTPPPPVPVDESYKTPCKAYAISTGHISVYAQRGGSPEPNRYIDGANDLCTIEEIYTDGWCWVTYPSGSSTHTAYTQTSQFIAGSLKTAYSATETKTAFRRSTGAEDVGRVDAGDRCVKVAEANGRIQLMYPVAGQSYYKMGWIDTPAMSPQGVFDEAAGGLYSVTVRGWAFDRDNLNQALTIQVYAGSTLIGTCIANQSRTDVNNAYPGVGNYHGFQATFDMSRYTGSQSIKVVAVNVGSGSNADLGTKTVTVITDTTAPSISNVSVSNITSEGYTVTCTVTDNSGIDRVQFPTWTTLDGQDDIFSNWQENTAARGTASGNTYTYRVLTSAHNGETGTYQTHIYAYDIHGNLSSYKGIGEITVPTPVDDVILSSTSLTLTGLNQSETLTVTIQPAGATDQNVMWASSNTNVAVVSNGIITATGFGTAEITATASSGISAVCTVFVLRPSYTVYYDANGGTGAPMNQLKSCDISLTLSSDEPTFPGYIFLGWATSVNGSVVYCPGDTYTVNANATLYAVWAPITYSVHYDANGGSGAPADQMKSYGVSLTLSSAVPTFPGYTFLGWAASSSGSAVYSAGGTYTANADVTLYAVWGAAGVAVTEFRLREQLVTVEVGKQASLVPVFTPANATNQKVTWTSLNAAVATIDQNGMVTGVKVGTAMIKAVCDDNGTAVYARVTVKQRSILKLPDSLIAIDTEAFAGDTSIETVEIGSKTVSIGSGAFRGCTGLKKIRIPSTVTDIALNAFDNCPDLVIHCAEGSVAWETALLRGIAFETDMD